MDSDHLNKSYATGRQRQQPRPTPTVQHQSIVFFRKSAGMSEEDFDITDEGFSNLRLLLRPEELKKFSIEARMALKNRFALANGKRRVNLVNREEPSSSSRQRVGRSTSCDPSTWAEG
ncbi:hypothetical protein RvY_18055 [Ramazzottius varieornatus]|uniref:Uncharacterized protein n=1 Tax=Ramazzottius varieornatus TaxID=947166 RepID=A0A1D1W4D0_RAMVA|nr:hypothetical protein RvY_18055 [Ramazzottius varieornatus]